MSDTSLPIIIKNAEGAVVARYRPQPPVNAREVLAAKFNGAGSLLDPEGYEVFSDKHVLVPGATYAHVPPVAAPQERFTEKTYYLVRAAVSDAKVKKGIRAHMFVLAQRSQALCVDLASAFRYDGNTLVIDLLFEKKMHALEFRNHLDLLPFEQPLLALGGLIDAPREVETVTSSAPMHSVLLRDYKPGDSDSPLTSLADFVPLSRSPYASSVHSLTAADPMTQFQSIEEQSLFLSTKPYRIHIKSQKDFPELADNDSNCFVGTWTPFHQCYDGLRTENNVPLLTISPWIEHDKAVVSIDPSIPGRYKVEIDVEFRNEVVQRSMVPLLKNGTRQIGPRQYRSFVFVESADVFVAALQWKDHQTRVMWSEQDHEDAMDD